MHPVRFLLVHAWELMLARCNGMLPRRKPGVSVQIQVAAEAVLTSVAYLGFHRGGC